MGKLIVMGGRDVEFESLKRRGGDGEGKGVLIQPTSVPARRRVGLIF